MHFMMACITVTWQQFEMGRAQVCCFCMHVVKSQSITWERVKDDGHYDNLWAVCISHPQMRWAVHHRYMSVTLPEMNAYLWVPLDNSTIFCNIESGENLQACPICGCIANGAATVRVKAIAKRFASAEQALLAWRKAEVTEAHASVSSGKSTFIATSIWG